jgi:DNA repair protein RadC
VIVPRYTLQLVRDKSIRYKRVTITSTQVAVNFCKEAMGFLAMLPREEFWIVALDTQHAPIGMQCITQGTLDASLVHPREVFIAAYLHNAAAILLVHNHPGGSCQPSAADHQVTTKMRAAGDILGIRVLDHIIVAYDDESQSVQAVSIEEC